MLSKLGCEQGLRQATLSINLDHVLQGEVDQVLFDDSVQCEGHLELVEDLRKELLVVVARRLTFFGAQKDERLEQLAHLGKLFLDLGETLALFVFESWVEMAGQDVARDGSVD